MVRVELLRYHIKWTYGLTRPNLTGRRRKSCEDEISHKQILNEIGPIGPYYE